MTSTWLVGAYLLFLAGMAMGMAYFGPHYGRIFGLALRSCGHEPSPGIERGSRLESSSARIGGGMVIWGGLLYLMIYKPSL